MWAQWHAFSIARTAQVIITIYQLCCIVAYQYITTISWKITRGKGEFELMGNLN